MYPYFVLSPEQGPRAMVLKFDCTVECKECKEYWSHPRASAAFGLAIAWHGDLLTLPR